MSQADPVTITLDGLLKKPPHPRRPQLLQVYVNVYWDLGLSAAVTAAYKRQLESAEATEVETPVNSDDSLDPESAQPEVSIPPELAARDPRKFKYLGVLHRVAREHWAKAPDSLHQRIREIREERYQKKVAEFERLQRPYAELGSEDTEMCVMDSSFDAFTDRLPGSSSSWRRGGKKQQNTSAPNSTSLLPSSLLARM